MIKLIQEIMSVSEWVDIADCPIQRNTERHAIKARNKHLKTCSPTHMRVSAAKLPTGEVYKLDGHTRAYLWEEGSLTPPGDIVKVDMYLVNNMSQVEELYKQFDNQFATENANDKLFGAFRLHNFNPESALVKTGGITSAMTICTKRSHQSLNIYQAIIPFMDALKIIDKRLFTCAQFSTGVLAAMILSVYLHGDNAMPFWERYHNDEGIKNGKKRDGVQALTEIVTGFRIGKKLGGNYPAIVELCSKALSTFYADMNGKFYSVGVKPMDLNSFLEKKIHNKSCYMKAVKNL